MLDMNEDFRSALGDRPFFEQNDTHYFSISHKFTQSRVT